MAVTERVSPPLSEEMGMTRRLFWAVRLVALVGIAGGLGGCAVYPASPGYAYRGAPGYYAAPAYRPYYGGGGGYYGRPGWGGPRGHWGRPYY